MPQYFIDDELREGKTVSISDKDFKHLVQVRRVNVGDGVHVRDKTGKLFSGWVASIGEASLTVDVGSLSKMQSHLPHVILAAALLKQGNFELVLQKAVELGCARIIPLVTERTIIEVKGKEEGKLVRWRKIAEEASKQSMRADIPVVDSVHSFSDLISHTKDIPLKIITHPSTGNPDFKTVCADSHASQALIAIGPEGGFSPDEIALAVNAGFHCVNFGDTQLRAETAGIVLPAILMHELGSIE
jgi:16S rRNA (uracil1498-N3)-methyltransferase